MFNIKVKRALEDEYSLVLKNGKPIVFKTETEARDWANENISKSKWIISFEIVKTN